MKELVLLYFIGASSAYHIGGRHQYIRELTDFLANSNTRFVEPSIKHSNSPNTRIEIQLDLYNLIDFDVSKGILQLSVVLHYEWDDVSLRWDEFTWEQYYVRIPINKIWFPSIYIQNTAKGLDGLSAAKSAMITYSGLVSYETPEVLHILCSPDVSKYPLDEHICAIKIAPLLANPGFTIGPHIVALMMEHLWENPSWDINEENVTTRDNKFIDIYIRLKRCPFFLFLNLISPVLVLGILNLFVFLLPQDSGERLSFSITMLLSFIVFISFTSEELPDSNTSICVFNVYLLAQLIESTAITLAVTFISYIHHKPEAETVPHIYRRLHCRREASVVPDSCQEPLGTDMIKTTDITWQKVSSTLNNICFILFVSLSLVEKVVVFVLIKLN